MPKRSIDSTAAVAIKRGKTNQEALDYVRKYFPRSNVSLATINYYRNHLRRVDSTIKSDRDTRKRGKYSARDPRLSS